MFVDRMGRRLTVEAVGNEESRVSGDWYRNSLLVKWINAGVLAIEREGRTADAENQ